ncbi:Hint domain-containing protein [Marivivens donghaensis]|uniref:Hint domain-containing protein n=1 Tax=Marivivens donghaensis TaxID=1699413 RepID=A0ABX0VYU9_9RHOB|nr:Hint domain-containing protein [Marivivens donghaensis]NIY73229.1 Hint domain-containing protein [Marivivens donghaensis]
MVKARELGYDSNASAVDMAQTIFGDGTTVLDASFTGDAGSSAIYSNGYLSDGVVPSETGLILSTGDAEDFTNRRGQANQNTNTSTDHWWNNDNDAGFNELAGTNTYDASYLDVTFIPDGDVMTMTFVFSSEEYPEYTGSIYNDVVGVWVNGENIPVSVGDGSTAISNINQSTNLNLFVSNTESQYNTEMDGFTVKMTLVMPVNSGEVNTIRIGIADVGDAQYDSNLIIAADSVQTSLVAGHDQLDIAPDQTKTFDLLANDYNGTNGVLRITHINNQEVVAGSVINLQTGQVITVNGDGTITVQADGDEETINLTYEVGAFDGDTLIKSDVGMATIDTVPCFTKGTRIQTTRGLIAIEELEVGDQVITFDNGPQPIRWIGSRTVAATGNLAPIRIKANTFGGHGEITVSPQHRVYLTDGFAALLFGHDEVLIKAKDLVNDDTVRRLEGGDVTYFHLLFDTHEIVLAEGLPTESFHPGFTVLASFEEEVREELLTLFPELADNSSYGPTARMSLKQHEVTVLLAGAA